MSVSWPWSENQTSLETLAWKPLHKRGRASTDQDVAGSVPVTMSQPSSSNFLAEPSAQRNESPALRLRLEKSAKERERARRLQFNSLLSSLESLFPNKDCQEKRCVSERILQAVDYIRSLEERKTDLCAKIEEAKTKSASSGTTVTNIEANFIGSSVLVEINVLKSTCYEVLIKAPKSKVVSSDVFRILESRCLEIVSAHFNELSTNGSLFTVIVKGNESMATDTLFKQSLREELYWQLFRDASE